MPSDSKRGMSGPPKDQHASDLKSDLAEELGGSICIKEDGLDVLVSRRRAILRTTSTAAIGGDNSAAALILGLADRLLGPAAEEDEGSVADQALLEDFVKREIARREAGGDDEDEGELE